jgi:small redox-active disulfide protein 2
MKKILVLGPGCPRCNQLAEAARTAADQLGIDYQLEKIQNINDITAHGVLLTPGLIVDGELKVQGKVPSVDQIKQMLA